MAPSMTTAFPAHSDLGAMVQRQQRPLKDPYAAAAAPGTGLSRRKVAPCLRKISAYNGGSLIPEDAEEYSPTDKGRYTLKKKLSFADQHGQQLALQHEFSRWDAPILCNVKLLPEFNTVTPASRPVEDVPSLERQRQQRPNWPSMYHARL
ncbi:hypothetical protein Poli38472_006656 [Pythium oligandrum]|uniref:Uncharacterized protein n=1 Tax=Pythium oligandrum TaxID=41045 RepID=A0A8K1C4Z6_PYTOL|nr:hypothetical protein Poli38472_006656 [Pythium oligandrum]|eukprot:TMW56646.1 hypothetical protein Poli38472_006656 [Pythium oligandrum]